MFYIPFFVTVIIDDGDGGHGCIIERSLIFQLKKFERETIPTQ